MVATKQFKAEISHRLVSSYSKKCQSIHGHSYIFEVALESEYLNEDGMVMDFGELKNKLSHLFEAWDHSFMFYSEDILADHYKAMLRLLPLRMVEIDYNPTAENMAYHIFRACVDNGLPVKEVRVQETLTGWAVAKRLKPFVGEEVTYYNIPEIEVQLGGNKRSYKCSK
jgi:6-pyruvoyltetrahydropterin/6-carboxytetrahydropterin synthase